MSKKNEVHLLPWNESFGGGRYYELVPFTGTPGQRPSEEGCFLLRPVDEKPDLKKMTKQQLIEYIEELEDD